MAPPAGIKVEMSCQVRKYGIIADLNSGGFLMWVFPDIRKHPLILAIGQFQCYETDGFTTQMICLHIRLG